MTGPETRASLLIRLRDPSEHEAWQEFIGIYDPLVLGLDKLDRLAALITRNGSDNTGPTTVADPFGPGEQDE